MCYSSGKNRVKTYLFFRARLQPPGRISVRSATTIVAEINRVLMAEYVEKAVRRLGKDSPVIVRLD